MCFGGWVDGCVYVEGVGWEGMCDAHGREEEGIWL